MTVVARVKEFQSHISSAEGEDWLLRIWRSSAPQCEEFYSSTRHRGCMEEIGSPDRGRRDLKSTMDVSARVFLWSGAMVGVFNYNAAVCDGIDGGARETWIVGIFCGACWFLWIKMNFYVTISILR